MSNPNGLDLSSVQLPPEQGEKPHDGDVTPATPFDNGQSTIVEKEKKAADDAAAAKAAADAKPDNKEPKKETEQKPAGDPNADAAASGKKDETLDADGKPIVETKPKDGEEDPEKKEELTPFHKHPDWIKSEKEKQELRDELNQMKGKLETVITKEQPTAAEQAAAKKTADERLQEDLDGGWEPKSQAEVMVRGFKYMREEIADQKKDEKQQEQTQQSEQEKEAQSLIGAAAAMYTELKMEDNLDERKVIGHWLAKQEAEGIIPKITSKNIGQQIKFAHDHLLAKGEIGKKTPVVEKKDDADDDPKKKDLTADQLAEQKKKDEINKKITRPSSDANASQEKAKKPFSELRGNDLDTIVFNLGKKLDGN